MEDHDRVMLERAFNSALVGGVPPIEILNFVANLAANAPPAPCWEEGSPNLWRYEARKDTGQIRRVVRTVAP